MTTSELKALNLVMNPDVCDTFPCVNGTWVTTNTILQRVVEGNTWNDILCWYPELEEKDIRNSLRYSCEMMYRERFKDVMCG